MRTLRMLALTTAALAYALIVLGAVVRITGSGLGCGDHWPLCNGYLIPPFDNLHVAIEWTHRLVAAVVTALVLAVAVVAWRNRRELGVAGRGGPLRPALLAAGLLIVPQALLGALAVWRELHAPVVTLHFATALALLTALLLTAGRAGFPAGSPPSPSTGRAVLAALGLSAATLLLGGYTASTQAGFACQGFPLCSGRLWPSAESGLAQIQWIHRLLAYALVLHLAGLPFRFRKRGERQDVVGLAWIALGTALLQVVVAAVMVTWSLPAGWRALHAAVGTVLWVVLVRLGTRVLPWAAGRVWPKTGT
jgi:cytochrome c oxidase assembly protein subunit 15